MGAWACRGGGGGKACIRTEGGREGWNAKGDVPAMAQINISLCKILVFPHETWVQGAWASHTQKHSEAGYGRPVHRGVWTAKTVKRPRQQPARPQYANYWAPLTRKRHTMPHLAQPQHTNYWALQTWKRHQQEHRPQRPTERSDPTQHAKGRTGDRPGPRKGTTTRRNVTQGVKFCAGKSPSGKLCVTPPPPPTHTLFFSLYGSVFACVPPMCHRTCFCLRLFGSLKWASPCPCPHKSLGM